MECEYEGQQSCRCHAKRDGIKCVKGDFLEKMAAVEILHIVHNRDVAIISFKARLADSARY